MGTVSGGINSGCESKNLFSFNSAIFSSATLLMSSSFMRDLAASIPYFFIKTSSFCVIGSTLYNPESIVLNSKSVSFSSILTCSPTPLTSTSIISFIPWKYPFISLWQAILLFTASII